MKKTPPRRIRLLRHPAEGDGVGLCAITSGKSSTFYVFYEIGSDIGGRGFAIHRLGVGPLYHVRVGRPEDCSCECMGYLAHGECKHLLGLLALVENNLI